MSDPLFNGRTYAENLDYISSANKSLFQTGFFGQGWAGFMRNALEIEANAAGKNLDAFFLQYNKNSDSPIPQTWESFITAFRRDFLNQNPPIPPESNSNPTFSSMASAFLGLASQHEMNSPLGTVLEILQNENVAIDSAQQFKRAFADFLSNYPYQPNGSLGNAQQFFQNFNEFMGIIAKVTEDGFVLDAAGFHGNVITSYQEIFEQMQAPSETRFTDAGVPYVHTPTFQEKFAEFYKAYVAEHGYFATGRALDDWTRKVQSEYSVGLKSNFPLTPTGGSGVSRAVTSRATGTTTFPIFTGDINTLVTNLVNDTNLTPNFFIGVSSPDANSSTSKFIYDEKYIKTASTSLFGGLIFSLNIPPEIGAIPAAKELYIRQALSTISFESSSTIPGDRTLTLEKTGEPTPLYQTTVTVTGLSYVNTSVTTDSTARVLVINRLFKLIAEMIDTMQQIAAAQAEYLSFLTEWQKAYTDLIGQIRTFTKGDGSIFGRADNPSATVQTFATQRNEANTFSLNQRERLSNLRGVVSDFAKREQSRINQSQDASTQQGQFATSLLQQLSTILGAIYR